MSDTGTGIAPENHANVFTPFWRGPEIKQYTQNSNGLELAIVREFARIMKGTIDQSMAFSNLMLKSYNLRRLQVANSGCTLEPTEKGFPT